MPTSTATPIPFVDIDTEEATIPEGGSLQVAATTNISNRTLTWSSSNSNIASVNSNGLVVANSVGSATITASSGGANDSALVEVVHGAVGSVQIGSGSGARLVAIVRDEAGHILPDREVVWSTSAPDIVDVDEETGQLTARAVGRVTITATSEGVTDDVSINVGTRQEPVATIKIEPGGFPLNITSRILMAVEVRSADGELLTDREITWSSDNDDVVSVDDRGLISAVSPGEASITATSEGVSVTETFTVKNPQVDYVLLSSESPDRSNPQPLQGISTFGDLHIFTSPDEQVSTVTFFVNDPNGESSPVKTESAAPYDMLGTLSNGTARTLDASLIPPDSYTITAEIVQTDGNIVTISATFSALSVPVDSVEIIPASLTVEEGRSTQLSIEVSDADDNLLEGREVTWASSNDNIASVGSDGMVTGVTEGAVTVSASVEGVSASIPVSVSSSQVTFALMFTTNFGPPDATDDEVIAAASDPDFFQDLNGASLFYDTIIFFVDPQEEISSVTYNLDGEPLGDFGSGGPVPGLGASFIFSASESTDELGSHSLVATVTSVDGETQTIAAVYDVIPVPIASVRVVRQPTSIFFDDLDIEELLTLPEPKSIPVGFNAKFYVIVEDVLGNFLEDREVEFSSSDDIIASIVTSDTQASDDEIGYTFYGRYTSENGNGGAIGTPQEITIFGESVGETTITATVDGVNASFNLNVHMPFESESLSTNGFHTCALTFEGNLYCWGLGENGQLGNFNAFSENSGTPESQKLPTLISAGGVKLDRVSANVSSQTSSFHTCGVAAFGPAVCWGEGESGQLGGGTEISGPAVGVPESLEFTQVVAGGEHSCAITLTSFSNFESIENNAYCWGSNLDGQLGDGTGISASEPVEVFGDQLFHELSAGENHTCGVNLLDETYCWGDNSSGQLGIGSITEDQLAPQLISNELGFNEISAGVNHTCGVFSEIDEPYQDTIDASGGPLYCWGSNEHGQLGDGTTEMQTSPVMVAGNGRLYGVDVGTDHTCAINSEDFELYCWGSNEHGQLGNGTMTQSLVPVLVSGDREFTEVTAGHGVTCAGTDNREILCWGSGEFGALGTGRDGAGYVELEPVTVANVPQFVQVSIGRDSACGLNNQGEAYCWGQDEFGQLGNGAEDGKLEPWIVQGGLIFQDLDSGTAHTCGITVEGDAYCWGLNFDGQVGDGTEDLRFSPIRVLGDLDFATISAGQFHTCATTVDDDAYCWGFGGKGQLGNGLLRDGYTETTPIAVSGSLSFSSVSTGGSHTCGITVEGDTYCWGDDSSGQRGEGFASLFRINNAGSLNGTVDLGDINTSQSLDSNALPQLVVGEHLFKQISAGFSHTCGVTVEGEIYCWGEGDNGRLGINSTQDMNVATLVTIQGESGFISVSAGTSHTCAVSEDQNLYCWGDSSDFRLGTGDFGNTLVGDQLTPVKIAADPDSSRDLNMKSVSVHSRFTCGLTKYSTAVCWGRGQFGQLGNGGTAFSQYPVTVRVPE